jgi:hypothetical protein
MVKVLLWIILPPLSALLRASAFKAHQLALAFEGILDRQYGMAKVNEPGDFQAFMQRYRASPSSPGESVGPWLRRTHLSSPPQHWVAYVHSRLAESQESQKAHEIQRISPSDTDSVQSQTARARPSLARENQGQRAPTSNRRLTTPSVSHLQDVPRSEAVSPEAKLPENNPSGARDSGRPDGDQRQREWKEAPVYSQEFGEHPAEGQPANQPRPRLTFRVNSIPLAPERGMARPEATPSADRNSPEQISASAATWSNGSSGFKEVRTSSVSQESITARVPSGPDWPPQNRYYPARPVYPKGSGKTSLSTQADASPDNAHGGRGLSQGIYGVIRSVTVEGESDSSGVGRFARKLAPLAAAFPWRGRRGFSQVSPPSQHPVEDTVWVPSEGISDHWPSLNEEMSSMEHLTANHLTATAIDDDWEAAQHHWQRLRRLDREQQGYLWSESRF